MEILEGIRGGSDRLPTPECSRYRLNRRSLLITERPGKRPPKPGSENIGLNGTSDASRLAGRLSALPRRKGLFVGRDHTLKRRDRFQSRFDGGPSPVSVSALNFGLSLNGFQGLLPLVPEASIF